MFRFLLYWAAHGILEQENRGKLSHRENEWGERGREEDSHNAHALSVVARETRENF
jgi:hypothetical protein